MSWWLVCCCLVAGLWGPVSVTDHRDTNMCIFWESFVVKRQESFLVFHEETEKENCGKQFTCLSHRVKERVKFRDVSHLEYRQREDCCTGYHFLNRQCVPVCRDRCVHGVCVGPDTCKCEPRWGGANCSTACVLDGQGVSVCLSPPETCVVSACHCHPQGGVYDPHSERCDCHPGYIGARCEQMCEPGHYGSGCEQSCDCEHGGQCLHVDGSCLCKQGYTGQRCHDRMCGTNHYGSECEHKCECEPRNTRSCHPITGVCVCASGWEQPLCREPCASGWGGDACLTNCLCLNGGECDRQTAACLCPPGYTGSHCETPVVCLPGRQDVGCVSQCLCDHDSCLAHNQTCVCQTSGAVCHHVPSLYSHFYCNPSYHSLSLASSPLVPAPPPPSSPQNHNKTNSNIKVTNKMESGVWRDLISTFPREDKHISACGKCNNHSNSLGSCTKDLTFSSVSESEGSSGENLYATILDLPSLPHSLHPPLPPPLHASLPPPLPPSLPPSLPASANEGGYVAMGVRGERDSKLSLPFPPSLAPSIPPPLAPTLPDDLPLAPSLPPPLPSPLPPSLPHSLAPSFPPSPSHCPPPTLPPSLPPSLHPSDTDNSGNHSDHTGRVEDAHPATCLYDSPRNSHILSHHHLPRVTHLSSLSLPLSPPLPPSLSHSLSPHRQAR